MNRPALHLCGMFVLVGGSAGCHRTTSASLQFDPSSARPGTSVVAQSNGRVFSKAQGETILINRQSVTPEEVIGPTEATFIVPSVSSGKQTVRVVDRDGKELGKGQLDILPSSSLRLLLTMKDGRIQLVNSKPTEGSYTENRAEQGPRVSYDVLTPEGGLLFTGAIAHPTREAHELFDEPQPGQRTIRREPVHGDATFVVKIPNVEGPAIVRFYDVQADVDLGTAQGRAGRKLIGEIKVGGQTR